MAYKNNAQFTISNTPGTSGGFVLSAATADHVGLVAGDDGLTFKAAIYEAGVGREVISGVYTHSSTTLSRGTLESSTSGARLNFTSAATVSLPGATAEVMGYLDMAALLALPETSITTTATATIGVMHVCSGTSADYTVTLPAVSGNANKLIGFRMAAGLTKLVTLDGSGSETIDGATTRVMWAGEVAILRCDGTTWTKVAGKSIPFSGAMYRSTAQSISNVTYSKVLVNTELFDNGGFADPTTNNRFDIRRPGVYAATVFGRIDGSGTFEVVVGCFVNGSERFRGSILALNNVSAGGAQNISLSAGDYVELYIFHSAGVSQNTLTSTGVQPVISLCEVPSW